MTKPDDSDRARSYAQPPRRRRRFSVWTLLAPAAAIILWVSFFTALGSSCIFKDCTDKAGSSESGDESGDARNDLARGTKSKVKDGDTLGDIAKKFDLTEDELKACNPLVDPQALRPGAFLTVSAIDCEEADKAEAGANPDPLAGDTTAGAGTAPNPAENGTAAADPSAQASADDAPADGAATTSTDG
jgi:LysM repeat protein